MSTFMLVITCIYVLLFARPTFGQTCLPNSNFTLTSQQIQAAKLSPAEAKLFEAALNLERSSYADGFVHDDAFYDVPTSFDPANPPPPGTILKVEALTNTTLYTIPPSLTMSRFLYTSETLNGTSIPASAYILWPYTPRKFAGLTCGTNSTGSTTFPVVGLAHGTSGQTPECACSHIRNLCDEFHEPFALALSGYAVVAPDYAGLGVSGVPSPYFVLPAQANDLIHAVQAAQSHFPSLSKEFVIMGQSQGGGVAWSYAQRQAERPVPGYLGTVAASPFTDIFGSIAADIQSENNARVVGIAQGLNTVLESFQLSDWITDLGIERLRLIQQVGACTTSATSIGGSAVQILKYGWNYTSSARWYQNVADNGRKPFGGPMLVLQGDIDGNAYAPVTFAAVNATCAMFPRNSLHYIQYTNISHVPVLYSSQHVWMDWIRDRFAGVKVPEGCVKEVLYPATGFANGAGQNWGIQLVV
ncbi:hypothetical protein K461DRAFT_243371 [Myriangium duriaei CBS 260.36]|uniref:Serine aminopeptidase S33 domain-containing protein n=1 Tax=Myriangium duriaei CBS 260.36 TaxID=1168546 RepID=A0A9P4IWW2_9PEZI|nr:hypothetical protein K461DRAFT_243371 [Myriangium duriaei CBS 260.36]